MIFQINQTKKALPIKEEPFVFNDGDDRDCVRDYDCGRDRDCGGDGGDDVPNQCELQHSNARSGNPRPPPQAQVWRGLFHAL